MVTAYLVLLAIVAAERVGELALSRRNAARAFARGGIELGRGHYRWMKLAHAAFLLACAGEVVLLRRPFFPWLGAPMLGLVLGAQALRYWAVAALGPAWNVRVIVVPGDRPVRKGPYRLVRHPNYLAVLVEGFALPLVHTAWWTATAMTIVNAVLLSVRIRCEEEALERYCGYRERFEATPRFLPAGHHGEAQR